MAEVKPVGWFNPWNDFHGYQQVAPECEGVGDTIPLYADDALNASFRAGQASILAMLKHAGDGSQDDLIALLEESTGCSGCTAIITLEALASAIEQKSKGQ